MDRQNERLKPGPYLPKVIRRIEWLILDISEKPCDACGNWPELHTWGIINFTGSRIIYCSESPVMHPIGHG